MPFDNKSRLAAPQKLIPGILFFAAMLISSTAGAQMRADTDLGAQWRVNSIARLMAGLPPMHPAHVDIARTDSWKAHAAAMQAAWKKVSAERIAAMTAWRDAAISTSTPASIPTSAPASTPSCPVGKTLLYPFAGPDFFNAWWMFPGCETFVLFGLEHIGEVPNVEKLNKRNVARLMGDVRAATTDFFDRNYFITENMSRQLRTAHLRGVVPLFMISMAVSGLDILRIVPLNIAPGPRSGGGKSLRALRGVTIEFLVPGSGVVRKLHYFSGDATDSGLSRYPEFLAFVRALAPTTTFLKSASYLLHSRDFSQVRNATLEVSGFLVQDDSGLPYGLLTARNWQVKLYGRYDVPIPPFQSAFQPALAKAYAEQRPDKLPFTFGYQFHDYRDERSNVMVGRGPVVDPRGGAADSGRGMSLRSSGRLDR